MERAIRNYQVLLFLFFGFIVTSCIKDPYTDNVNQEKNQIAAYVASHYRDFKLNTDGLYYISQVEGTGDTVSSTSDYVLITYGARFLDGTLFDTTATNVVLSPWFKTGGPFTLSIGYPFAGLIEGIAQMREGGSATLVMPSTLSFNDFKPRIYNVTLLKVFHNIAASRKLEFDSTFMVPMGFAVSDSASGNLYMKLDSTSMAPTGINLAKIGDTVAVKYTGMILDSITGIVPRGRTFATEDSAMFIVGSSPDFVFQGALTKMKIGWTTTVYLPFYDAFGDKIIIDNNSGQILVSPYSNLMYSIEFLGFVKDVIVNKKEKWIIDKIRK